MADDLDVSMAQQQGFDHWVILELMGHRRLAGKVTEAEIGGARFIRIDVPGKDGFQTTQFYSPQAVYCITPTSEAVAREVAQVCACGPVHPWEFNRRSLPAGFEARSDEWEDD